MHESVHGQLSMQRLVNNTFSQPRSAEEKRQCESTYQAEFQRGHIAVKSVKS